MSLVTIGLLYGAGLSLGVSMPATDSLTMTGLLIGGLAPFAALGILLGHLLTVDAMGPAVGGVTSLLALVSGTWFPIKSGFVGDLAKFLPSYWLNEASRVPLSGHAWSAKGWAVVIVVVTLAGCGGGAGTRRPASPRPATAPRAPALSLAQAVGQTLVLSFDGLREPAYVARILRARRAAGVILTAENVSSPGQVLALDRSLERSASGRALIGADQEGGAVRTLAFAGPAAAQAEQAGPSAARAAATAAGRALRSLGLNVDFAPVADVAAPGSVVRSRAYPGPAAAVAAAVGAAVAGYRAAGIAATAKHFPGLGAATANTDAGPVTIATPRTRLLARDLVPFRAAIGAGAPLVMVSHAVYTGLDMTRIASQSSAIIDRLLRESLHFAGVVITDSIEAGAVRLRSSVAVAAERSIAAGADVVLMTGPGSYRPVFARLLSAARRSPAFRHRIRQAAARVIALERRLARG